MRAILLVGLLGITPAFAASEPAARPSNGRFALHAEACKANDIFLTLKDDRIDLPVFSCTGLAFKPVSARGDTAVWDVAAKHCEGEEGKPGPQRFKLEAKGTSLRILWSDGAKSAPLIRCGK